MRSQKDLYPQKVELADIGTWSDEDIQRAKDLWNKEFQYSVHYQDMIRRQRSRSSCLSMDKQK